MYVCNKNSLEMAQVQLYYLAVPEVVEIIKCIVCTCIWYIVPPLPDKRLSFSFSSVPSLYKSVYMFVCHVTNKCLSLLISTSSGTDR